MKRKKENIAQSLYK